MSTYRWKTGLAGLAIGFIALPTAAQSSPGNQSSQIQAEAIANQRAQARTQVSRERLEQERRKPAPAKQEAEASAPAPMAKKAADAKTGQH